MLNIKSLSVTVQEQEIIKNCSLEVLPGSVHAVMGPNGSGKSSLALTLMGSPHYRVTAGSITFFDSDITALTPDKRAQQGLFLVLQYPCEITGLTVFNFLKEAYYALHGVIDIQEFQAMLYAAMDRLCIDHGFAYRYVNEGFSGGEKKRCEMLQLLILQPKIAIIDEIDSGLDVDALKIVAQGIAYARERNPQLSIILITHYQRILRYLHPDVVHIMHNGAIVRSGNAELAQEIEQHGYENIVQSSANG